MSEQDVRIRTGYHQHAQNYFLSRQLSGVCPVPTFSVELCITDDAGNPRRSRRVYIYIYKAGPPWCTGHQRRQTTYTCTSRKVKPASLNAPVLGTWCGCPKGPSSSRPGCPWVSPVMASFENPSMHPRWMDSLSDSWKDPSVHNRELQSPKYLFVYLFANPKITFSQFLATLSWLISCHASSLLLHQLLGMHFRLLSYALDNITQKEL